MADRPKMCREERAKQFMPFAALKGYPEAVRRKEKLKVDKRELSEEYEEALDYKLRRIRRKDMITVIYFHKNEYLKQTGMVSGIDETAGILCIVNTRIAFDDIYDISGEKFED